MRNKLRKISILTVLLLFASTGLANAQTPDVKESLEETKESVDELITAKDEDSPFDLSLRIKTFKEVVNLSITEAEDLKINLLVLDLENEDISNWRDGAVEKLNEAIKYYEEQKQYIEDNESDLTLEEIKSLAKDFKEWRAKNYIPLHNKVRNILIIKKESRVLETAWNRWNKVNNDLELLSRYGIIGGDSNVWEMLSSAENSLEEGASKNEQALSMFVDSISPKSEQASSSTSTISTTEATSSTKAESTSSTPEELTTEELENVKIMSTEEDGEVSTSSQKEQATSSSADGEAAENSKMIPDSMNSSIKGLVGSSLKDIKGAYQVFIEMSSFVRKLLQ